MGSYLRAQPQDCVALSGDAADRLLRSGDGDAALLYLAILRQSGGSPPDKLAEHLGWSPERMEHAVDGLVKLELLVRPCVPEEREPETARRPEYTRLDLTKALEGQEFSALKSAVEQKLGKLLTTPDVNILLGLYDYLGMPADVIFLLVSFCVDRTRSQYGQGRRPTLRQIEQEGYRWARMGLLGHEQAAAYINRCHERRQQMPQLMRLLGLGDRAPAPSEERYLSAWLDMGFAAEVIEQAYDRTVLHCKELKWPYLHKILQAWHKEGLHTAEELERRKKSHTEKPAQDAKADWERMQRYLQRLQEDE